MDHLQLRRIARSIVLGLFVKAAQSSSGCGRSPGFFSRMRLKIEIAFPVVVLQLHVDEAELDPDVQIIRSRRLDGLR